MLAEDRLREILNEISPPLEPSPEVRAEARARLQRAIHRAARPRPPLWRRPVTAWAAAAMAAAVLVGVLIVPGSTPAVDANLANIARAARALSVEELPAGAYLYVRTESRELVDADSSTGRITYLVPRAVDMWTSGATTVERRTTGEPQFFDAESERQFYAGGLDEAEGIGETAIVSVADVPNRARIRGLAVDADQLQRQIYRELAQDPDWSPDNEARTMQHLAELMHPRLDAPPPLRAALLEVLGRLDIDTRRVAGGGVVASLEYERAGFGKFLHELEFDGDGYLKVDRLSLIEAASTLGLPLGIHEERIYSRPAIVDDEVLPAVD